MKKRIKLLRHVVAGLLFALVVYPLAQATEITRPVVLVATDRLTGLPYEETVLLVVPAGDGQHLGLILNRPTTLGLATVFPDATPFRGTEGTVFFGGPAMSGVLIAAARATFPPSDHSIPLMPGLFLVTDKDTLGRLTKGNSNSARYFTGFVVWGATELSAEILAGAWDIKPADIEIMFRVNPQKLWIELAQPKKHVATR